MLDQTPLIRTGFVLVVAYWVAIVLLITGNAVYQSETSSVLGAIDITLKILPVAVPVAFVVIVATAAGTGSIRDVLGGETRDA